MLVTLLKKINSYRRITVKKQLITAAAALMILGGTTANAATCVAFTGFCDGLEVTASGGQITGFWRNTDCAGTDVPISGVAQGGIAKVACTGACVGGARWGWLAETALDGTMDMYQNAGAGWTLWIDELAYTTSLGACPFSPFDNGGGGTPSSAQ